MLRRIILLIIISSFVLAMTGCRPSKEKIIEEMLNSLEEKYGEKFVCYGFRGPSIIDLDNNYTIWVYPEANEDLTFTAEKGTNSDSIKDEYLLLLLKPEIEQSINIIIRKYFSDYKIGIIIDDRYLDEYDKNTTFRDLLDDKVWLDIFIHMYIKITDENEGVIEQCAFELMDKYKVNNILICTVFLQYYDEIEPEKVYTEIGYDKEYFYNTSYRYLLSEYDNMN